MEEPRRLGDRYELGPILGRGGMAEVHNARDRRLGRAVAVKMLRVDLARDPSFQARFRREAQSAASLNHPSIVAVYDTGEDIIDGLSLPYIVMEFVDGSTLRELLQSGRQLLPERTMEITAGVLQALAYSHTNGIIHRDIKPGNVMLTRSGAVKVMDFGIARAIADTSAAMTQTAAVIGTAQYLSPEQARGEPVDARSDLYSTGCLLYELMVGRPPFVGDSPVSVAYQHVREDPVPPSQLDPEVSPEMDRIILKSLAKNPDNRYQNADEMRADLESCLDGRPVSAPPVMSQSTQRMQAASQTQTYQPVRDDYYEEQGDGGRRAGYALLAIAVVALFLGALFLGKVVFGKVSGGGKEVEVPSLIGTTLTEARSILEGKGLALGDVTRTRPPDDTPRDRIFRHAPDPNQPVPQGTRVAVFVSTGPANAAPKSNGDQRFEVPELVGRTETEARAMVAGASLRFTITRENSDAPKGQVIRQSPSPGTMLPLSGEVQMVISRGPRQGESQPPEQPRTVEVPGLVGMTMQSAIGQLQQRGLQAAVNRKLVPIGEPNRVTDQDPGPGTPVPPGSTVTITVSETAPTGSASPPSSSPSTSPSPSPSESESESPPGQGRRIPPGWLKDEFED
jgi:eukaryotic-like serine/threonine-protein kinase